MKKVLTVLFVLALALAFTAPAMALKLETKGYMDVAGILVKNNVVDQNANTQTQSTAAWYQQEMIIEPVLHVNEWVRIHNKITIMERYWRGGHGAENDFINDIGDAKTRGANYRGEHNFWWEQMYLSFPLAGGHLYVGRRPGGAWGFPFQDSSSNRDRIQWVGKVLGKYTVAGVIEKLAEADASLATATTMTGPFLGYPSNPVSPTPIVNNAPYGQSASDIDAYALGFVIPITKEFSWQPLFYYIKNQTHMATEIDYKNYKYIFLFDNAFKYKAGPFKVDAEINWWKLGYDKTNPQYDTTTRKRIAGWIDMAYTTGPYELGVGGFYLQGSTASKNRQIASVGEDFEPYFLLFSEDVGLLWNTGGVENGTTGGSSGYLSAYLRGGYKITDAMLLTAKLGFLRADKMNEAVYWAGGPKITPSKKLGTEFDLGYEFKFMKNIKYVVDAGVFFPGKYWDHTDGDPNRDLTNNVYGVRHMLVIEW